MVSWADFLHRACGFSYTLRAVIDLSDPAQFEAAYRRFAPLGFRIARRMLGDSAAAEEVVQELFLQLWRNPGGFDAARGPLQSYVAMLARSRSIDRWRTRSADLDASRRLVDEARALRDDRTDGADLPLGTAKSRIRLGLSRARTHLGEAA